MPKVRITEQRNCAISHFHERIVHKVAKWKCSNETQRKKEPPIQQEEPIHTRIVLKWTLNQNQHRHQQLQRIHSHAFIRNTERSECGGCQCNAPAQRHSCTWARQRKENKQIVVVNGCCWCCSTMLLLLLLSMVIIDLNTSIGMRPNVCLRFLNWMCANMYIYSKWIFDNGLTLAVLCVHTHTNTPTHAPAFVCGLVSRQRARMCQPISLRARTQYVLTATAHRTPVCNSWMKF